MGEHNLVSGQVAKIVSDTDILINRGTEDGIENGAYFVVLDKDELEIEDPENAVIAGSVRNVKLAFQVVQVSEHLSLARTFRTYTVNVGGQGPDMSSLMGFGKAPKYIQEIERFTADPEDKIDRSTVRKNIAIGDEVREMANREDASQPIVLL